MSISRPLAGLAWRATRHRFHPAVAAPDDGLTARYRVDPDWRRTPDGYALRLDTRTTIDVKEPVGRWREVDPRAPHEGWRSPWKTVGLVLWGSAVGTGWWLGSSRGRGPLAVLHRDDDRW